MAKDTAGHKQLDDDTPSLRVTPAENLNETPVQSSQSSISYFLMKAEPDSRIVKEKDVKFSVDDFEAAQTTAWEGVRNYEARNIMQTMKIGDKVLFYHSNTKNPGIAGFAEVSTEAYPDHTAWDEDHPYYDAKSISSSPRWYMVDLRFVSRATHFVSLPLLRHLSQFSKVPEEMPYLSAGDLKAIRNMALLNKGRLSVQKVDKDAWNAINKIAEHGDGGINVKRTAKKPATEKAPTRDSGENEDHAFDADEKDGDRVKGKRKAKEHAEGTRKSKRKRD